jgi:hypothetical protein
MQHFSVPEKVIAARGPIGGLAMKYFFMRYAELEKSNFPIETKENAFCLVILCASVLMYLFDDRITEFFGLLSSSLSLSPSPSSTLPISLSSFAIFLGSLALFISFFTTVICTAPVIGRIMPVHRWYLWFVHYPIFRMCEALDWCTGTNKHGYIMHLTASKLLGYGYVSPEQMDNICSLAIVRDPYSRMVSIYGYNRFGEFETFPVFVRRWKKLMRHYIERGEKEDWYTPCHLLPQFEYTHFEGKQLVQSIVKQEELKYLKTRKGAKEVMDMDSTVSDLPDLVRDALLGMPHANSRKSSKQYYDYYDQESLDLTFEMYSKDFEVFGYNTTLKERPDLLPPKGSRAPKGGSANRRTIFADQTKVERMSRNILYDSVAGRRVSEAQLFSMVKTNVKQSMNRRSSTSALMQSLSELDKDELLAWIAGERTTFEDSGHKDD